MLQRLLDGERVIVRTWRGGLDTLARLREAMDPPPVQAPRPQRRAFKARFEAAAARLVFAGSGWSWGILVFLVYTFSLLVST